METELAQRENDGIAVTLLWHIHSDRLTVTVRDSFTRLGAGSSRSRPASLPTRSGQS